MVRIKRCKKCFLSEDYPNITFDSKGLCNFCATEKTVDDTQEQMKRKKEFEQYLDTIRGRHTYDCILLYSGGKDSTYLLYLLKEKYGLKVLTVTFDNGMHTRASHQNITVAVQRFHADHLTITPENNLFKRLYKYALMHPGNERYCNHVCPLCQRVMQSTALNLAVERDIPFVAIGYSPDQALRSNRYEVPHETLQKSWMPSFVKEAPFTKDDYKYFWNPDKQTRIPRFFLPFHFLGYPGSNTILRFLTERGLGTRKTFHPFKSNCKFFWLLMYLDLNKFNSNAYFEDVSTQLRKGIELGNPNRWSLIMTLGSRLYKTGLVRTREMLWARKYLEIESFGSLIYPKTPRY